MFDWFKKKTPREEKPRPPEIRDTLFGDRPLSQWPPASSEVERQEPWASFVSARMQLERKNAPEAIRILRDIVERKGLESRHYAQGWHFLRELGAAPEPAIAKTLLGVVVEVGMKQGLDIVAAYPDRSARYYNFSGAGVVWEAPDASLDEAVTGLLRAGQGVVAAIGPWEGPRPPAPGAGVVRLSMLTPSGIHFGQGPFSALASDGMGGPLIHAATVLMQQLIAKTQAGKA